LSGERKIRERGKKRKVGGRRPKGATYVQRAEQKKRKEARTGGRQRRREARRTVKGLYSKTNSTILLGFINQG